MRCEAERCHDAESVSFSSAGVSGKYGAATVAGYRGTMQHLPGMIKKILDFCYNSGPIYQSELIDISQGIGTYRTLSRA